MGRLEAPDEPISLKRAAQIAGLKTKTLQKQADRGRLGTTRYGHERLTTRRLLHAYIVAADEHDKGARKPLPVDYIPVE